VIVAILRHVLVAPVAVADDRLRLGDELAVHLQELHPQHPVGAGMLGAQVQDVSFFFQSE
jgi:hypothetical protein